MARAVVPSTSPGQEREHRGLSAKREPQPSLLRASGQSSVPPEMRRGGLPRGPTQDKARGSWARHTAQLTAVLHMHLRLQVLGVDVLVGLVLFGRAARPAAEEAATAAAAAGESTAAERQGLRRGTRQPL